MKLYSIHLSLFDLFHLAKYSLGPTMLLKVARFHSFYDFYVSICSYVCLGALSVAVPTWDLLKEVTCIFITSSIVWLQVNNREGTQLYPSTKHWIKDLMSMALELPDVQAGFRKGRGIRDQIAKIRWIIEKAREFQKNIYFCFLTMQSLWLCGSQ